MAKVPHRISYDLLSDDVKAIISAGLIVFDVTYDYVFANLNPDGYDYVRVTNGEHRNEIYAWNEEFKLLGMHAHNHDNMYYTKRQVVDQYYDKPAIDNKLNVKADKDIKIGTIQPTDNNFWYKEI